MSFSPVSPYYINLKQHTSRWKETEVGCFSGYEYFQSMETVNKTKMKISESRILLEPDVI